MKNLKNLIILLGLIFVFCVVQVLKVVMAAEPSNKIAELGLVFHFSLVYIVLSFTTVMQFIIIFWQGKKNKHRCAH